MKSHYEKLSLVSLGIMEEGGIMASSILVQNEQITVDEFEPVLFDDGEGKTRDYIDITFE